MSDLTAHFRSWIRRGLASDPAAIDASRGAPMVVVTVAFDGQAPVPVEHLLVTSGAVRGLTLQGRIRSYPGDAQVIEPTFLPYVELADIDLPWRYSTVARDGRVLPWLFLLTLEEGEFAIEAPRSPDSGLPGVVLKAPVLPEPSQAWAWAHVQVLAREVDPAAIDDLLKSGSARAVARILSPRALRPARRYTSFLVPLFKAGASAGLDGKLARDPHDAFAWSKGQTGVKLPFYHSFSFSTTEAGDFLELVGRLREQSLGSSAGTRPYDARDAFIEELGVSLTAAEAKNCSSLRAPSALMPIDGVDRTWPRGVPVQSIEQKLAQALDQQAQARSSPGAEPVVGPPLYGGAHAGVQRVGSLVNHWVRDLNLDPSMRVVASLGAECVRQNQTALLDEAWNQVDGVAEANRRLAALDLADEASRRLHRKHLDTREQEAKRAELPSMLAPMARALPSAPAGALSALKSSALSHAILDPQWRRLTRPTGMVGRRLKHAGGSGPLAIRRNAMGTIRSAPEYQVDKQSMPFGEVAQSAGHPPDVASAITLFNAPQPGLPLRPGMVQLAFDAASKTLETEIGPGSASWGRGAATIATGSSATLARDRLLAHPVLRAPLYELLAELSPEWILAGLGGVEPDSIVALKTCDRFVEACLVGANHELARELLWHEYPTDQRGTCLPFFWQPIEDGAPDIGPIPKWRGRLGKNRAAGSAEAFVLLVRSEVFRRFGEVLVYALQGDPMSAAVAETIEVPRFRGQLGADMRFYGFSFSAAEARSRYFVFQENPVALRFGLPDRSSTALSWASLAGDPHGAHLDLVTHAPQGASAAVWADATRTSGTLAAAFLRTATRVLVEGARFFES